MASPSNEPRDQAKEPRRLQTVAVTAGRPNVSGSPMNQAIQPTSNYRNNNEPTNRSYSRTDGTDSWVAFEHAMGQLEGGEAVSFASGMAAVSAIFAGLGPSSKVAIPFGCYHGVTALANDGQDRLGWTVERIQTSDTTAWVDALKRADLVWLESPSNPLLEIADLPTICQGADKSRAIVAVDNTFATPLLQRPLDWGATFSVHSASKFIGGHSDLLSGVVVSRDSEALGSIKQRRSQGGATPGALESYLALRGLRTLPLRLECSQRNAGILAERLSRHRIVTKVRYPGLKSHPDFDLAATTLAGPGAVLSFETLGSAISADVRISRLELIQPATSLGGVETTIERRNKLAGQEHVPPTLMRLSIGIEHVEDLWADLNQALDGMV